MDDSLRQREKPRLLRVTMPNGEVICYNRVKATFLEALKKLGSENYDKIDLKVADCPMLSKEVYPKFKDSTEDLVDGWHVIMVGGTSGRYLQLRSIAQQLKINMEVEIGENFITQKVATNLAGRKRDNKLLVRFPDGTFVAGDNPIDTLLETIWKIGPDVIKRKELEWMGKPVVTLTKVYNGQVQVGKNLWLNVPGSTADKCRILRAISTQMRLNLDVNII